MKVREVVTVVLVVGLALQFVTTWLMSDDAEKCTIETKVSDTKSTYEYPNIEECKALQLKHKA
ncbi:TMhelix containing protein [Vibrio phage 1.204.O._10N.222.46.F12]|uniref:TMhelix containing protein n=1 Tax=Vibrio phage 1.204.O._10N.222.46.F12 TaxID=1881263 RepID=A0A2I7RNN3_9CAUD|nr:TMhelix containing protein [Vibrio phage 1.204.O._10N.222.46.F12]AUR95255.1 TMhelix containing protein [Vibrio phage 1.204.O._10N.222.46.F12]